MFFIGSGVLNLELAIKHIDKIIIQPNEIFSIWKLVGRPSKRKGYLEGLVLNNGKIDNTGSEIS